MVSYVVSLFCSHAVFIGKINENFAKEKIVLRYLSLTPIAAQLQIIRHVIFVVRLVARIYMFVQFFSHVFFQNVAIFEYPFAINTR